MTYFFCYDIKDTRRRNKISKSLERFGIRMQKSIFQCDVSQEKADEIWKALIEILLQKEDSLLFFPLCDSCSDKAILLGNKNFLKIENFEIL